MATLQNQVQGVQVRAPGRPRVLGQAADDFPRTCFFSQLLALIVVYTVAPCCWNQQEPHVPRKRRAFVPRGLLLIEVFTWAFTCKLNARTSNDLRWLPERKESGENRPTSEFELELSPWITLRQIIPDE